MVYYGTIDYYLLLSVIVYKSVQCMDKYVKIEQLINSSNNSGNKAAVPKQYLLICEVNGCVNASYFITIKNRTSPSPDGICVFSTTSDTFGAFIRRFSTCDFL